MPAAGGTGERRAVVSSSDDGGKTWAAPVFASGPDEKVQEIGMPVVGPDGAVYIVWRNRDDPSYQTQQRPLVVAKSIDGGATFTRTPIFDVGPAPATAPAPAGFAGYPRIAVDPRSGALYVVYPGFTFGDLDTVIQRSTDGGASWSPPVRVNDDPKGNGVRQLATKVAVRQTAGSTSPGWTPGPPTRAPSFPGRVASATSTTPLRATGGPPFPPTAGSPTGPSTSTRPCSPASAPTP